MFQAFRPLPSPKSGGNRIFRQETPPGLRLDLAYLIEKSDGTCVMLHQHEALTKTTELLTRLTWFTLPRFKPATNGSAA